MDGLDDFARDLFAAAPPVRVRLGAAADEDRELEVLWLARAGGALCEALPTLAPQEARAAFDVVERGVRSEAMSTAVCTGLLEAVAGRVSRGEIDATVVAGLLGPQSRAYIDAWDRFTLGRPSLDPARAACRSWFRRCRPSPRSAR